MGTSDAIVIGAGVQGASTAFQLASRGLSVQVLERSVLGAGATGRSSGFVRMHYDLESECRLAAASLPYFVDWEARIGPGDPGFVRTGFVQIVEPTHERALRQNVAMQQALGIDTALVNRDDLADLAPGIDASDVGVAAYERSSGYADPTATATGFLDGARARGATYHRGVTVTALRADGDRITGVDTDAGRFDAPVVVLAAGAWSAIVAETVGLRIPVTTWREHTVFFVVPPALRGGFPAVIDDINVCSFRPEGQTMLLAGLEDANEFGRPPDSAIGAVPEAVLEQLAGRLARRLPLMVDGGFHSTLSGQDGLTPDQRAILGAAGPDGLYLQCGFSGTGFKTAPAIGVCIAELITEGRSRTVDISGYDYRRFEEDRPLTGENAYPALWR